MWIYMAHKSAYDKALKAHYKQILTTTLLLYTQLT